MRAQNEGTHNSRMFKEEAKAERGFTLIETLVSMGILVIALGGILSLGAYSINYNSGATAREQAIALIQQRMEQIRSVPFNDASLNAGTTQANVTSGGQSFTITTTVCNTSACGGSSTLKSIKIQVTPNGPSNKWARTPIVVTVQRTATSMGVN